MYDHCFLPLENNLEITGPTSCCFLRLDCGVVENPTIDNLRRRCAGVGLVLYVEWRGSVEHLLLHCPFARDLWSMVFELFGVTWVMPISVLDLLECWQGSFGRHRNSSISRVVPHCLMWCIWRERNGCSFEDCERSYVEIKLFFLRSLFDWVAG